MRELHLSTKPLTADAFRPYGQVLEHPTSPDSLSVAANAGTALRSNFLASLVNAHGEGGRPNMCLFRCSPNPEQPFRLRLLERHPLSSQAFIPMVSVADVPPSFPGYLVIVAPTLPDGSPDIHNVEAFIAASNQGINYNQATWHHPMVALHHTTDFTCLVWESGVPEKDCEVWEVPSDLSCTLPLP